MLDRTFGPAPRVSPTTKLRGAIGKLSYVYGSAPLFYFFFDLFFFSSCQRPFRRHPSRPLRRPSNRLSSHLLPTLAHGRLTHVIMSCRNLGILKFGTFGTIYHNHAVRSWTNKVGVLAGSANMHATHNAPLTSHPTPQLRGAAWAQRQAQCCAACRSARAAKPPTRLLLPRPNHLVSKPD